MNQPTFACEDKLSPHYLSALACIWSFTSPVSRSLLSDLNVRLSWLHTDWLTAAAVGKMLSEDAVTVLKPLFCGPSQR